MNLDTGNVITIVVYLVSFTALFSRVVTSIKYIDEKIDRLEKKQDKHNSVIERMVVVEQGLKSVFHRIDSVEEKLDKED